MKIFSILSAIILSASAASAATLTFEGDICNSGDSCSNGFQIDQSYGDIAGEVNVVYDANTATAATENLLYWSTGYETLEDVAYSLSSGTGMSIDFIAETGYEVTLSGFDIAPYLNRTPSTQVKVTEIGGATILDTGDFVASTDDVTNFLLSATSQTGFRIEFGPDSWNVGIDNIEYSTAKITSVPTVPLPAAGWMLMAGVGGLFAARRKQS